MIFHVPWLVALLVISCKSLLIRVAWQGGVHALEIQDYMFPACRHTIALRGSAC